MKRLTKDELVFYDQLAEQVRVLLCSRGRELTRATLARRIGWNPSSLCRFLNRANKSIALHFIAAIAPALRVPIDQLMIDGNWARAETADARTLIFEPANQPNVLTIHA